MRTLFRRLPHATRIGLILAFLLLSIPAICGVAVIYIANIRSDLAEVVGSEVPLAEQVTSVAIGGLGQAVLFERVVRLGAEAQRDPATTGAYQNTKTIYQAIGTEIAATIEAGKVRAKDLIVGSANAQSRTDSLVMQELLQEMDRDFSSFQVRADEIFALIDGGQVDLGLREAVAAASPRNLKLRAQIERIMKDVDGLTASAVAEAAQREQRALVTLGLLLFMVFAVGTYGGIYSLRMLGHDLLRRQMRENRLHQRASHDKLTGLPNRAHFRSLTEKALESAKRGATKTAILFIDIDGFKAVNDEHGHAAGDEVLKEIAERLNRSVREADTAGRLGGDEFAVNITHAESPEAARVAARRIVDYLSVPYYAAGKKLDLSASIGIAMCPGDADDIDTLLRRADQAMYAAKEIGGNSVLLFSELMDATIHGDSVVQFATSG